MEVSKLFDLEIIYRSKKINQFQYSKASTLKDLKLFLIKIITKASSHFSFYTLALLLSLESFFQV